MVLEFQKLPFAQKVLLVQGDQVALLVRLTLFLHLLPRHHLSREVLVHQELHHDLEFLQVLSVRGIPEIQEGL